MNLAGVDASLELWRLENFFYPPTLRIATNPTTEEAIALTSLPADQPAAVTLPIIVTTTTSSSNSAKEGEAEPANPSLKTIS